MTLAVSGMHPIISASLSQESVRVASAALVRTLRGLTLRMADPEMSPAADATAAIKTALPLLLAKGKAFAVLVQVILCQALS